MVYGVEDNGTVAVAHEDIAEDFSSKLINPAPRYEKIQPRVRNVPQAFFPEFQLGNMHSVEKLKERNFRPEEGRGDIAQLPEKPLYFPVHHFHLRRVEVLCELEAIKGFSLGVELACLNGVLGIEGRSPVIEETGSIYYHETFDVVECFVE